MDSLKRDNSWVYPASPVNTTPVEILCEIFSDVVNSHLPLCGQNPSPYRRNSELLNLTAVCKRWRSVASGCATLWNTIVFSTSVPSTVECALFFLGRSKETMLFLHIVDSGTPRHPEAIRYCRELLQMVVIQSHRLSSCEFSSPYPDFWSYWSLPAPNLRKLVVHGRGVGASPMFSGSLPRLETLTSTFYVPWLLGNYNSLKQADLCNHGQHRITITMLLNALRGCETLEKLSLHGYACLDNGTPRSSTVSLPRLSELNLFSSDSALILEHLETPSLTGPVVILDSNPEDHILRCIPRAQRYAPYLEGITKLSIVLISHATRFSITGYREDGIVALYIGACGVEHWYRWTWVQASIQAIASSAHFPGIRNLTVSTDAPVVPWSLWLPSLNDVKKLTVSCPRSENLLVGLLATSSEDGLLPCPSLESLALYRCGERAVVDHTRLMGFVISRYRAGRPLRKLKLHNDDWDWIQQLDKSWVALAQSQSTKGDNVLIDLPLDVDIEAFVKRFHTPDPIDWSRTGFYLS